MIISTVEFVPGYEVEEILGIVNGNVVKSRHIGRDIGALFKTIVGGEIKGYTELLASSREEALERMIEEAEKIGADGIIGMRFYSSSVMQGASEVVAYGTAVKLRKK